MRRGRSRILFPVKVERQIVSRCLGEVPVGLQGREAIGKPLLS